MVPATPQLMPTERNVPLREQLVVFVGIRRAGAAWSASLRRQNAATHGSLPSQERRKLLKAAAARDERPVLASDRSAQVITRRPVLTPSHRNGSGAHRGD